MPSGKIVHGRVPFSARQDYFNDSYAYDTLSARQKRVAHLIIAGVDRDKAWKELGFSTAHGYRMVRHPKFKWHIACMKQQIEDKFLDIQARKQAVEVAQGMADMRLPRHVELLTEIAESPSSEVKDKLKAIAQEKTYSQLADKGVAQQGAQAVQVNIGEEFLSRWERVRSFTTGSVPAAVQDASEQSIEEDGDEE